MSKLRTGWHFLLEVLWAILLVTLPVTSFPFLGKVLGAIVSPLSLIPLALLFIFWFIPYLFKRGKIPVETTPLFVFVIVACISSAAAFFVVIPTFKGRSILGQELRAFITLGIGLSYYLISSTWNRDPESLQKTLRWIHIGGAAMILWSLTQAYVILSNDYVFFARLTGIYEFLMIRSPDLIILSKRVMGFAYEASWLGHMFVMLYFPLWISSAFTRRSVFSVRMLFLNVEDILLLFGLIVFYMASPRIAILSFLLIVGLVFLLINQQAYRKVITWVKKERNLSHYQETALKALLIGAFIALYVFCFWGVLKVASQNDSRLAAIFENTFSTQQFVKLLALDENTVLVFSRKLLFMERVAYWLTGFRVFADHPFLGVGLGNAGFFFLDKMPAIGWGSFEIRQILFYANHIPNTKSLWSRLLAETGLLGFGTFFAWIFVLWKASNFASRSRQTAIHLAAFAGPFALVALLGEGFSIDSFAMPYLWVSAGLITSSVFLYRSELTTKPREDL